MNIYVAKKDIYVAKLKQHDALKKQHNLIYSIGRCGKIRFLSIMARTDHLRAPSRNEKLQDAQACMMRDRDIRVRRNSKRIFGSLILSSTAGARDSFQRG